MVIEVGFEIIVKVGGSFVKVDLVGVYLFGVLVNFNFGGSVGSGSGFGGVMFVLLGGLEFVVVLVLL